MNISYEEYRLMNGIGTDLVIVNMISYSLELIQCICAIIIILFYFVVSKICKRYHPLLRVLMISLLLGMLDNAISRSIVIPMRYISETPQSSWMSVIDSIVKVTRNHAIVHIDWTNFFISLERFTATCLINTYEHRFNNMFVNILLVVVISCSIHMLMYSLANWNLFGVTEFIGLGIIAVSSTAANLMGILLLAWSRHHTLEMIHETHYNLSTTYQGKETIEAVRLLWPVNLMIFVSRIIQFLVMAYGGYVGVQWGALPNRIVAQGFNQIFAFTVLLCPILLIVNQPSILKRTRRMIGISQKVNPAPTSVSYQRVTEAYFKDLRTAWEVELPVRGSTPPIDSERSI